MSSSAIRVPGPSSNVLGDADAEARERAEVVRRQQVRGQTAIGFLEQVWNRDLSSYDPDGPLPSVDPVVGDNTVAQGRASVRAYGRRSSAPRPPSDASDGFVLVPHVTPGGLDGFADTVVPLLQERGVFRTEHNGRTLRDHLFGEA